MSEYSRQQTQALTFDLFGTVLDLHGSLVPALETFLQRRRITAITAPDLWERWRARQRHEQFMDTLLHVGHSGYLETVRRALTYVLELEDLPRTSADIIELMEAWPHLRPFPEVGDALERLQSRFRLVVLSNGDREFLAHLVAEQVGWQGFEEVFSVDDVGHFKPHPAVYRRAARNLGLEVGQCLMVSANSFDVVGARACGLRAAFVNRNRLPCDDQPYRPDLTVDDFTGLADALL